MSLFDQLGGQHSAQQPAQNPQQTLAELKANPAAVLQRVGLNIPSGLNDPQQIVQHLLQSGQVPQTRLAQAMRMLGR